MAKNKRKKNKKRTDPKLSPRQYVKTKARELPIHECLINNDWESAGIANIILARKHKSGTITWGAYLVDILCLGVKDTFYAFNELEVEYEDMKRSMEDRGIDYSECDYALAHNIIYGAIDFAAQYGFHPHPEFSITQRLLEKDHDAIPDMVIEFGEAGKPCLVTVSEEQSQRIIAQLEKTAGEGGFNVVVLDDDGEDDFDDLEIEDDPLYWDEEDWKQFEAGEKDLSPEQLHDMIDQVYDIHFKEETESGAAAPQALELTTYKISYDPIAHANLTQLSGEEIKRLQELHELVTSKNPKRAIKLLQKLIEQEPGNPIYYNFLTVAYENAGKRRKAKQMVEYTYKRFPDYLFAKCNYAEVLLHKNNIDKIPEIFDQTFELQSLYPDRDEFHISEVLSFYSIMCRYFAAIDEIDTADIYAGLLESVGDLEFPMRERAITELRLKKLEKIMEVVPDKD